MNLALSIAKRIFKIILWVLGIFISLFVLLIIVVSFSNSVPNGYTSKVQTGGSIESEYLAAGGCDVEHQKIEAEEPINAVHIYYPKNLNKTSSQYPLVMVANGTGVLPDKFKAYFKHLASWGFIVVGNDDPSSGNGHTMDLTLDYILSQNMEPGSFLYNKVNADCIGIIGHSQGGAGVLCSISSGEHKADYKTAVALSPTHEETAIQLGWNYHMEDISIPVFLLAGTEGDFENELVIPKAAMQEMYAKIPADKAMARRVGADHGAMLYSADGYATAWLMWQLKGDEHAKEAFWGQNPELLSNTLYQDAEVDI